MEKAIKMTNVKALSFVLENCDIPTDVREKLERMKTACEKKSTSSGSKKMSPTQIENEHFKALILDFLATLPDDSDGVTCTEILKAIPDLCDNYQVQKVTGLMRQLSPATEKNPNGSGQVVSKEVKGKPLYRLA
jgi:hypothetical protein